MVSYTSFMYFRRVIWLSKGYFDSSWLLSLWVRFGLNFLHLIHIPRISKRAVCLHKIILSLSLKSYLILKVHGWYVFGIKTRDENGINLMFPGIQNPFQEIFFSVVLAVVFVYTCDILKTSSFLFVHMWFEERNHYFYVCSFRVLMT